MSRSLRAAVLRVARSPGLFAALFAALLAGLLVLETLFVVRREYLPAVDYVVSASVAPPGPVRGAPLRLVVLGDSTVAGIGSPTVDESLPVLVAERVAAQLGRTVEVLGHGVSGATTASVLDEQVAELAPGVDVVLIVIGSNDVTHVTPWWVLDEQTRSLLRAARKRADAPVVLGGIPEFATTPALPQPLRAVVAAYAIPLRAAQRRAARDVGAAFVDIAHEASPRFIGRPESMSADGFHPSPVGYGFWADALAPAVARVVR